MRDRWTSRAVLLALTVLSSLPLVLRSPEVGLAAAERKSDLSTASPESVGVSSERLRRLDAGMKGLVDEGKLAGIVTLLARHGKVVHFSAAGRQDIRQPAPVRKDSVFRIYSMTKPVTGVAMMMLHEEGKWRLDDPVSKYIPEFSSLKVRVGENADGTPKLEAARRSMTMRELMTHTAGLAYGLANDPVDKLYRETRVLNSAATLQSMIEGLAKLPLLAQPGARWYYSIAVDVQGYLVEKFSGQKFDEFLQTRIFQPLGMKDTAFYLPKEKLPRLALVHGEDAAGKLTPPNDNRGDPTVKPLGPSGGGGLFSTAEDYLRFAQMLLDGGQLNGVRLLAPRTVEMMRTNHVQPEALKTMRPGNGWGMDFSVVMDAAAAGEPFSNGAYYWWGAAGTWFWIDPVEDFTFIGMIQHQNTRTSTEIHGLSRNLVYQAILN